MCDTTIKKTDWLFPVKNIAESSKALQQQLMLKLEFPKCFQIESGTYVEKCKAKTAAERTREYRQRQKLKCEVDRSDVHIPGMSLKPEIKTADERQLDVKCRAKTAAERTREYRQRQKLKCELNRSDVDVPVICLNPEIKPADEQQQDVKCKAITAAERTQEYRQRQKLKCEQNRSHVDVPGICLNPKIETSYDQQRALKRKAEAERSKRRRKYRKWQKLICELNKSNVDVPGICLKPDIKTADERQQDVKCKAKTASERVREYRQRQKLKCELNRSHVDVPGICLNPEIKPADEQQRDVKCKPKTAAERNRKYRQRQKLKRALKKFDELSSMFKTHAYPGTKVTNEQNQDCRKAQKLIIINDLKKYCDKGSLSREDSEEQNQAYGQEQTIDGAVKECDKVELIRKEHLAKDAAISAEINLECPNLDKDLEKCIEQTSICGNIVKTYNSSAEYFFNSMID